MSTASTKSHSRKKATRARAAAKNGEVQTPVTQPVVVSSGPVVVPLKPPVSRALVITDRVWLIASIAILVFSAALRLYSLELKPAHHDEGVNGFFLTNLVRQGVYRYDPANYHGPTLYYLTLPFVALFGLSTFSARLVTAIFGIGIVWLILKLRRQLGDVAVLAAAALFAVSPGAVFYSRYFIHEILVAFFSLGIVVAAVRFHETRRKSFVLWGSVSASLLFATKETAFVTVGTLLLAMLVAWWWTTRSQFDLERFMSSVFGFPSKSKGRENRHNTTTVDLRPAWSRDHIPILIVAGVVFVLIFGLFYSSFFSNSSGISDALEAMKVWSTTGTSDFHAKPFDTYLIWLFQEELPILLLAVAGAFIALFSSRTNRFAVFVSAWAFGMLAAYSLIPYKTPWLVLSFTLPMGIAGGYAIDQLSQLSISDLKLPRTALIVAGIALTISTYQSLILNFHQYDNDQYPYVYAHTSRELLSLVDQVERIAKQSGNAQIGVSIASPENWPLPWYFRDNPRVGFLGSIAGNYDPKETPIVIGRESSEPSEDQTAKLQQMLGREYEKISSYTLRPGVRLALFVRRDLAPKN